MHFADTLCVDLLLYFVTSYRSAAHVPMYTSDSALVMQVTCFAPDNKGLRMTHLVWRSCKWNQNASLSLHVVIYESNVSLKRGWQQWSEDNIWMEETKIIMNLTNKIKNTFKVPNEFSFLIFYISFTGWRVGGQPVSPGLCIKPTYRSDPVSQICSHTNAALHFWNHSYLSGWGRSLQLASSPQWD